MLKHKLILMKDKKAGKRLMAFYWFFCMVFVGAGITIAILSSFGAEIDMRGKEAGMLSEKLIDCLIDNNGFLKFEVLEKNFDIFSFCKIKKGLFQEESVFYFKISFLREDRSLLRGEIEEGDASFELSCEVSEGGKIAKNYPQCVHKQELIFYFERNKAEYGTLEILSASNQRGESN